jgi:hypothetical protein
MYPSETSLYFMVPAAVLSTLSSSSSVAQFIDHQIDIPQPISLYSWTRYSRSLSMNVASKVALSEEAKCYGILFTERTAFADRSLNEHDHLRHRTPFVQRLCLLSGCVYSVLDTHVTVLQMCTCTWRGVRRPLWFNRPSQESGPAREMRSLLQTDTC